MTIDRLVPTTSGAVPVIQDHIGAVEEQVEVLLKIVEALEEKLCPILSNPIPPPPEALIEDRPTLSPIATRIEIIGCRLIGIKMQLMDIDKRAEL